MDINPTLRSFSFVHVRLSCLGFCCILFRLYGVNSGSGVQSGNMLSAKIANAQFSGKSNSMIRLK